MQHNSRRVVLYHPRVIAALRNTLAEAKDDLRDLHHRHLAELADLRAEISELRSILADVVTSLRTQADQDVAALRRQLMIALARLKRDPQRPLH